MRPSLLLYFNEMDRELYRIDEIEKIFEGFNIERQSDIGVDVENTGPQIIIITVSVLDETMIGSLLYVKEYYSNNLVVVYRDIDDIIPYLDQGIPEFIDVANLSKLEPYSLSSSDHYSKEEKYNQMISSFLNPDKVLSYLIYTDQDGLKVKFKEDHLLPGYQEYSQQIINKSIMKTVQSFHMHQSYSKGVKLITDQDNFYAILLLAFSMKNPEAMDPRLKTKTLYTIVMYIPQLLAVQLPRDELLLDYAELVSDLASPPIDRENMQVIKSALLGKLGQYFSKGSTGSRPGGMDASFDTYDEILALHHKSDKSITRAIIDDTDTFQFIKLKMFQFEADIGGTLEESFITDLLVKIKSINISKRRYADRSLSLRRIYSRYSLEEYWSDKFEVDLAVYHKMLAYYFLRISQHDKAHGHIKEAIRLFNKNGVKNEILSEAYRYLAFYLARKKDDSESLDAFLSEFINRLQVLKGTKLISGQSNAFVRNFVSRAINLRALGSFAESSNNSLYAYSLLISLLDNDDLDQENRKNYHTQVFKAIMNYSFSLVQQEVPFDLILSNLDYIIGIIERYPLDLGIVLEVFDFKLRCFLAMDKDLASEISSINDIIVKRFDKSLVHHIKDSSKDSIDNDILLFRMDLYIRLSTNSPIDNHCLTRIKEVVFTDPTYNYFNSHYSSYLMVLWMMGDNEARFDILDHFQSVCEEEFYYDTAFVLAVILHRISGLSTYQDKIQRLSEYEFRFDDTRAYRTDEREPVTVLKEFLWERLTNFREDIEDIFEYVLLPEASETEFGGSNYELSPDDVDRSILEDRVKKT